MHRVETKIPKGVEGSAGTSTGVATCPPFFLGTFSREWDGPPKRSCIWEWGFLVRSLIPVSFCFEETALVFFAILLLGAVAAAPLLSPMNTDWLLHPFAFGLYVGLIPAIFFRFQLYLAQRDVQKAAKQHLSQLQALTDAFQKLQGDLSASAAENENLRLKVQTLQQSTDRQKLRQLEVLLRAEQRLTLTAPGFAPAWQTAKNEALSELEEEERGKNVPKQMFSHLVNTGSALLSRIRNSTPSDASASPPSSQA